MGNVQALRNAILTLENIRKSESGSEWLSETIGQTSGSLIDMLELVVDELVKGTAPIQGGGSDS